MRFSPSFQPPLQQVCSDCSCFGCNAIIRSLRANPSDRSRVNLAPEIGENQVSFLLPENIPFSIKPNSLQGHFLPPEALRYVVTLRTSSAKLILAAFLEIASNDINLHGRGILKTEKTDFFRFYFFIPQYQNILFNTISFAVERTSGFLETSYHSYFQWVIRVWVTENITWIMRVCYTLKFSAIISAIIL